MVGSNRSCSLTKRYVLESCLSEDTKHRQMIENKCTGKQRYIFLKLISSNISMLFSLARCAKVPTFVCSSFSSHFHSLIANTFYLSHFSTLFFCTTSVSSADDSTSRLHLLLPPSTGKWPQLFHAASPPSPIPRTLNSPNHHGIESFIRRMVSPKFSFLSLSASFDSFAIEREREREGESSITNDAFIHVS